MPGIPDIALGADEFLYASVEDTYGVWKRPVAGDGVRVREISFSRSQERVTRDDKLGTRSHTERITRKKAVEFNLTAYVVPSGTFGTAPDIGPILKALLGAENVTGSGVEYTCVRDQNISLTLHRLGDNYAESLTGCVPNSATFRWSGTDEPVVEISGFGKDWVVTGEGIIDLAISAGGYTARVPQAQDVADVNSMIAVEYGGTIYDNGGVGYHVSAVTPAEWIPITITTNTNDWLDFDEGIGEVNAQIAAGTYNTALDFCAAVKAAMEVAGTETYSVTYNDKPYGDNKFTIASLTGSSLSLLWLTGTNSTGGTGWTISVEMNMGLLADMTGALSYEGLSGVAQGEITIDDVGGWEAAWGAPSNIIPFFPAATTSGSPSNSITGSFEFDSVALRTTEGSVEYNGNMTSRNDIFGEESSIGFSVAGRREVTLSVTSFLESDYVNLVKDFNRFDETHSIRVTLTHGGGAGTICYIDMPSVEFDNIPFTVPEQEEATVVFTGMALDQAAPYEGEYKITFA